MLAAEYRDKMKKTLGRVLSLIFAMVLFAALLSGCGEKNPNEEKWPQKGAAASVPVPVDGVVTNAISSDDVDGNDFAIIVVKEFTAENMGDYIRLILKKGFTTTKEQSVTDNYVDYAAKKDKIRLSLRLDTEKNEMKIEVETR